MNRTEATMDDLPELPFEQILSYLSVEDRLKSRAVSRSWRRKFDFKLKSLCCSKHPSDFIFGKSRWISGPFVRNFFGSPRFASFFDTFGRSTLSNLKRLRLCRLYLKEANVTTFTRTLNSFGQLEELSIISFSVHSESSPYPGMEFELKLPVLTSIYFERVHDIKTLTLDAPKLQKAILVNCDRLSLVIVHGESVERLAESSEYTAVNQLKNLLYLYTKCPAVDSTLLSVLDQLKEIHLTSDFSVKSLFEQKRRYGRTNLKIYLCGLLLNGPDDPAIHSLSLPFNEPIFVQLAKHSSRLAKEIAFYDFIDYSAIKRVAPQAAINLLGRFSNLCLIFVDRSIEDIERFLDILKNSHIEMLNFLCDQPQELFDRLPEYSALQSLDIHSELPDLNFLFRLKHLMWLQLPDCSIDAELIRKIFEELPFLTFFQFKCNDQYVSIQNPAKWAHPRRFTVRFGYKKATNVTGLEAAIQLLVKNVP